MRLEIIANHSVEEDILEALRQRGVGKYFTKIPSVQGIGSSDPRLGDHIWPEENFLLILYCDARQTDRVVEAVKEVKARFKDEGIKLFAVPESKELV